MQISPFMPMGKTVSLTTNATPSTANSTQILPSDFGLTNGLPTQYMLVSNGASDIWVVFANNSTDAAAAALPTAGTTTVGTPQKGFRLKPGVVMVVTFGAGILFVGNASTGISQNFDITPGEGS